MSGPGGSAQPMQARRASASAQQPHSEIFSLRMSWQACEHHGAEWRMARHEDAQHFAVASCCRCLEWSSLAHPQKRERHVWEHMTERAQRMLLRQAPLFLLPDRVGVFLVATGDSSDVVRAMEMTAGPEVRTPGVYPAQNKRCTVPSHPHAPPENRPCEVGHRLSQIGSEQGIGEAGTETIP